MRIIRFDVWCCLAISYGVGWLPNLMIEDYSTLVHLMILPVIFIILRRVGAQLGLFASIFYRGNSEQLTFTQKMLKKFSYDYCNTCKQDMYEVRSKLYLVPLNASEEIPLDMKFDYFEQNAQPISELSKIPTGYHGAYAKTYRCDNCSKQNEAFEVFLPVRGQIIEKRNFQIEGGRLKNLKEYD